jgi:hypothetical protein
MSENLKIGFYGHSSCSSVGDGSYLSLIAEKFNADIVNTGVKQGSEERILLELKKEKNLDVAIIFHSRPSFIFLPNCKRDIGINSFTLERARYLFEGGYGEELATFESPEMLHYHIESYKSFFSSPDLMRNRYYGALCQIDDYLAIKKIKCIHITTEKYIPKWFKFRSGIVNFDIMSEVNKFSLIQGQSYFHNFMTPGGNQFLFEKLFPIISELINT